VFHAPLTAQQNWLGTDFLLFAAVLALACEPSNSDFVVSEVVVTRLADETPATFEITLTVGGPRTDLTVSDLAIIRDGLSGEPDQLFALSLDCGEQGEKSIERRVGDPVDVYGTLLEKNLGVDAPVEVQCNFSATRTPPLSGDIELRWHAELSSVWESDSDLDLEVTVTEI
jgi:hypothetical protein